MTNSAREWGCNEGLMPFLSPQPTSKHGERHFHSPRTERK